MRKSFFYVLALGLLVAFTASSAKADDARIAPMKALAAKIRTTWVEDPVVVNAIKAQNKEHASFTAADIDKLDKKWRAETKTAAGTGPFINKVLSNKLSQFLKQVQAKSGGLYTEIFVEDNKGMNVGQSDVTSDYMQGDEAKWQKTYLVGPKAIHIGPVEQDESTQRFQSHLSLTIVDPATGKPIGAVTIGVDMQTLGV